MCLFSVRCVVACWIAPSFIRGSVKPETKHGCPSGPRGYVKAVMCSHSRVRVPLRAFLFVLFFCVSFPVAGAWRWKSSDPIHCIQSIPSIFRFWILFFRKVVCFGIESPLVGFPRFGRDGATPWQLPGMEPSSMTIISSRLQDDITYWMGNLHLLPFSHCA